jgi:hypothetical protein
VDDLPVLGLAALATVCDELAPSAVLERGTMAWHAAAGALLGREGIFSEAIIMRSALSIVNQPHLFVPHCHLSVQTSSLQGITSNIYIARVNIFYLSFCVACEYINVLQKVSKTLIRMRLL